MSSIETLFAEYMAEHRSGGSADPLEYLSRAAPTERRELAALIDGYLARARRTPLAQHPPPSPRAEATIDALSRSIGGAAGLWPALLPRLRDRAGLKRRDLVEQLARALGVSKRESKVERYYHEMELGLLPAGGVSDRVLDALAKLLRTTAAELRDAGRTLGDGVRTPAQAEAFARITHVEETGTPVHAMAPPAEEEQPDDVDELFRGGN